MDLDGWGTEFLNTLIEFYCTPKTTKTGRVFNPNPDLNREALLGTFQAFKREMYQKRYGMTILYQINNLYRYSVLTGYSIKADWRMERDKQYCTF